MATYYIDPDADAGGDGTTNALTGGNCAYQSLNAAEAARNSGSLSEPLIFECCSNGAEHTADTVSCTVTGSTASAANYIEVRAEAASRAVASGWSDSKYRLSVSNARGLYPTSTQYFRLDGLQIETYDNASTLAVFANGVASGASYYRISNCRMRMDNNAGVTSNVMSMADGDLVECDIYNVIAYARSDNQGTVDGIYLNGTTAGDLNIYNCTVFNTRRAIRDGSAAARVAVYDSAVFNNSGNDFYGTATAFYAVDHCASDDNIGTNDVAESGGGAWWPDDFEGAENGDVRLKATSNLVNAAGAAGSALFSVDIDREARTGTWDIGADQRPAAGGGPVILISGTSTLTAGIRGIGRASSQVTGTGVLQSKITGKLSLSSLISGSSAVQSFLRGIGRISSTPAGIGTITATGHAVSSIAQIFARIYGSSTVRATLGPSSAWVTTGVIANYVKVGAMLNAGVSLLTKRNQRRIGR